MNKIIVFSFTLKEETFAEENFRDFAIFVKIREKFVPAKYLLTINRESLFSRKKKRVLDSRKSRNLKIYIYRK